MKCYDIKCFVNDGIFLCEEVFYTNIDYIYVIWYSLLDKQKFNKVKRRENNFKYD